MLDLDWQGWGGGTGRRVGRQVLGVLEVLPRRWVVWCGSCPTLLGSGGTNLITNFSNLRVKFKGRE